MNPIKQSKSNKQKLLDIKQDKFLSYFENKITYLNKKSDVFAPVHVELFYIAKTNQTFYTQKDFENFLGKFFSGELAMPKGIITTLFMIYGKISLSSPKPPIIMAKLLYYDVTHTQEFCYFNKAELFITRVQLTYFFPPSQLSPETKLYLFRFSRPGANEISPNFFEWGSAEKPGVAHIQKTAAEYINCINNQNETDTRYADALVCFFTIPAGIYTFINSFYYIERTFKDYMPRLFSRVVFFVNWASKPVGLEFIETFLKLKPSSHVEEFKECLENLQKDEDYSSLIHNSKLMNVFQNSNEILDMNSLMKSLYESDDSLEKIKSHFKNLSPLLSYTYCFLKTYVENNTITESGYSKTVDIFHTLLDYTQVDTNIDMLCDLIHIFLANVAISKIENKAKEISEILIPKDFKNKGLPFRQDAIYYVIRDPCAHKYAYIMICAAAKYQSGCQKPPIIKGNQTPISDIIIKFCDDNNIEKSTKSFVLGLLLIILSPNDIGFRINQISSTELKEKFNYFLRIFLSRSKNDELLKENVDFDEGISSNSTLEEQKQYISQFTQIKYFLNYNILQCQTPNYLEQIILTDNQIYPAPDYMINLDTKLLEKLDSKALTKYVFENLIKIIDGTSQYVSDIMNMDEINELKDLLEKKEIEKNEKELLLQYYSEFFLYQERSVRVSAYVLIYILNSSYFRIPDNPQTVRIVSQALYIDNEVEIAKAFIKYLDSSKYSDNLLKQFVEKRPLLSNCLQEHALNKLLKQQISNYINFQPDYNFPNFSILQRKLDPGSYTSHFHNIIPPTSNRNNLQALPNDIPPFIQAEKEFDQNLKNNFTYSSTNIEKTIYNFEVTLYNANDEDPHFWFTLASLKRYMLESNNAFLLYAKPSIRCIYNEIIHATLLSKEMLNRLLFLLIISYIKTTSNPSNITKEVDYFIKSELIPSFKQISKFELFEQHKHENKIISILIDNLLGIKTKYEVYSFILPSDIPWDMMISDSVMIESLKKSILITTDEYASQWLLKARLETLNIDNKDMVKRILIPLILSSSYDAIKTFFQYISESNLSNSFNALKDNITSIILKIYNSTT